MRIRLANSKDVATYTALAHAAQAWLRSRGLNQYVPAAHDEYTAAIRSRVESGTLFAVQHADQAIAFFSLEASPSQWWPADKISAVYLAGIVVARSARGRGIGGVIVEWSLREAARLGFQCVRLDCHADNLWLRRYYEDHGFTLRDQVEQHPGYYGCMYQRDVESTCRCSKGGNEK
jgi:GNAT superfamily N-acetyltransferase